MQPRDIVSIPYPVPWFRYIKPRLKGGEEGVYLKGYMNGVGEMLHEIEIDGEVYPLREGEFEEKQP